MHLHYSSAIEAEHSQYSSPIKSKSMPIEENNLTFVSYCPSRRKKTIDSKLKLTSQSQMAVCTLRRNLSCSCALRSSIQQSSQIVFQLLRQKKTSQAQYKIVVRSLTLNILHNVFVLLKGC